MMQNVRLKKQGSVEMISGISMGMSMSTEFVSPIDAIRRLYDDGEKCSESICFDNKTLRVDYALVDYFDGETASTNGHVIIISKRIPKRFLKTTLLHEYIERDIFNATTDRSVKTYHHAFATILELAYARAKYNPKEMYKHKCWKKRLGDNLFYRRVLSKVEEIAKCISLADLQLVIMGPLESEEDLSLEDTLSEVLCSKLGEDDDSLAVLFDEIDRYRTKRRLF